MVECRKWGGGFYAQQKEQNEGVKDLAGRILAITEFWKQFFPGFFFPVGVSLRGAGCTVERSH